MIARGAAPRRRRWFTGAEDRKGRHVDEHLLRFNGVLQVDAYAGYNRLTKRSRAGGSVTLGILSGPRTA